jgi:hypothetical protein
VKQIPLTKGMFALVDDEDFDTLSTRRWCVSGKPGDSYAVRGITLPSGKSRIIRMHREILSAVVGQEVDHVNGDRLDNRRCNLRFCTRGENCYNARLRSNNRSGYRGVRYCPQLNKTNPWSAQIKGDKRLRHIGYFPTAKDAAMAYNEKAKELHGEFARINPL